MTALSHIFDQLRLYAAEILIRLAISLAPANHPDSMAIYEAAAHVARRKMK